MYCRFISYLLGNNWLCQNLEMKKKQFFLHNIFNFKALLVFVLLLLVFGVTTKTTAQCTGPYTRFESIGSSTANTTGFTFTSGGVGSNVSIARSGRYYFVEGALNAALTTPQIDNPKSFSFYVKCNNTLAAYILEYSVNAGAWTDATPYATSTPPSVSTSWQLVSYSFTTATFNSTNVRFRIRDTYARVSASTLYLDDISWTCYVSGTASTVGTGFPETTTVASVQTGNGTPSACSGTTVVLDTYPNGGSYNSLASYNFYDNGGATDEYSANQINQVTFKPTAAGFAAGDRIRVQFITYAVGNTGDTIEIWDDNGGTLNGTTNLLTHSALGAPTITTYISTISADGSITIKFTSDGATNAAGFNIKVDCIRCNAAPSGIVTTAVGATTASLTWNNTPAAPYDIYYSTSNATTPLGGNVTPQGVNLGTNSYNLTGLAINTTYYVWVRSRCGSSPDSYGPWSSSINFSTVDCSAFVIATSPSSATQSLCLNAAPTALSVSASGGTISTYQWYSNTSNSNSGGTLISGATSSSYTPLTTSTGTLYYYCVITSTIACTATSAVSGPVIVTTVPLAPFASAGSGATSSAITANWAAAAGATGYYLDVSTDSGFTSMVSGYNNLSVGNVITYSVTGIAAGTTYYYRVRAANTCGSGTSSGTIIIATLTSSNNQCANATTLPCATSNLLGTTVLAASYTHGTGCLMSNYGVWYTFTGDGNTSTISVTTTSNDIELSISYGSCGGLINIACQDSALSNGTETYTFTTTVGVNYYVYIANWYSAGISTDTGSFTISRTCVAPFNPCTSITNIANCGTATNVTIASGNGGYSTSSCGWTTPGIERIFTFTPTSTGNFTITQTSSFGFIDYQFKPVSLGCSSSGWTCIDDLSGAGISPSFTLTAGTQYYILLDPEVSTGGSVNFTINCPTPPLTNDDPCNAIALTVSTTCNYATYTNSGATASGGITAPGCANYSGGDVWFSAVVPATGVLTLDLQSGVMTDSGMAFYSGTCGSLTLLDCDDDDSVNGAMSNISIIGLTPGQTIFIRVWEYGNDNNGTFAICATTPSCPPPTDLYSNILSTTSATINWLNTSPPSSNGYQYYITTTNNPPTSGSTPSGSTAAGVNGVTLTGLIAGQVYYFWVRAYCGGTDYSSWFGPTNFTLCAVGSGSGTTTLSCPSVVVGGEELNGADPFALVCSVSTCTNLEATYLQLNQATNYTVSSIPYAPPYQYSCLQNPVSINVDDKWSPTINLPFNFCFYGNNYNRCLIGSNGVITFDTTNNTPGGYSTWSFNTDLPSTSLFKNSIFGVYHDIDPGLGGEVGWELITLNTGCRALVASWNNIPMFSSTCNSILYTGMIVLYENTNIIDVFIKEKNVCETWNSGNAIVGIQNSTGSVAVVAPNRNGLSANWTVSNEAWRFTPSGPSLTSIQWYEGQGTTGTALGTTDLITVCPSVTTTYTAEVTYALCNGTNLKYTDNTVVTVSGTKIWDGSTNSNWNVDANWTPSGVPTSANCIIIPDVTNDPIISAVPDGVGYNLLVYPNAQLTINSNQNLTITDKVTVQTNGIFTINNSASLIQINNILNSGNIIYKRESPNIRTLDYSYWSSPVDAFTVNNIVSPYTFGPIYKWNTTIPNSNAGWGGWQNAAGNIMIAGKGYIARAPGAAPFNNTTYNVLSGSFTGVPNNGNITIPIERGPDQNTANHYGTNGMQITNMSDNWNLLGNPYPSAIRASQFLFDNRTKIEGNVRLWTHGTLPSVIQPNPFYGSFISNYSPGDYYQYNFSGTSCCPTAASDLFIGAAQGFFVQMIDGPPVAAVDNNTVAFTNSLRNASFSNNTFYRTQNTTTTTLVDVNNIERNRIWLDFINSTNNQTDRILFGYIENATMGKDSFYDCSSQNTGGTIIYSLIDDAKFGIQGRALPFDVNDEVPIGINAPIQGNYTIAIVAVDGLFNNQNIYLKDNLLNITHNLKVSPYNFTTQSGEFNNRFKIVYISNALGINNPNEINTFAMISNNTIRVESSELIKEITVYDIAGKLINTYLLNEYKNQFTSPFNYANGVYIAKITLENNMVVSKKLIH